MTSYVFTILEKKYYWDKVYNVLEEKYGKSFELVLALKKSNPEKEEILKFAKSVKRVSVLLLDDNKTENALVNEAIKATQGTELVLCRDYFDLKSIMSDYMVEMGRQGAQVVVYRKVKKQSKIKKFFSKWYNKLVSYIFGFSLYGGEVGLVYFNNIALSVMKELPNNTVLTKVNKWAGFETSYIDIESQEISEAKLEKTELKPVIKRIAIYSSVSVAILAALIVLVAIKKLSFILGLVLVFGFLVLQFILFYNVLKYTIINKYGDLLP